MDVWNGTTAVILLTLAVIFVNGWTDAPNAIAAAVATGALPMRRAAGWAALCNVLGTAVMCRFRPAVAYAMGSIVDLTAGRGSKAEPSPSTLTILLSATLLTIVFWSVGAWVFGIPTSESHSLIAALTGAALALYGDASVIRWNVWVTVVAGMAGSIVLGFASAYLISWMGQHLRDARKEKWWNERRGGHHGGIHGGHHGRHHGGLHGRRHGGLRFLQIVLAMSLAFLHGAQDGQKFAALLLLAMGLTSGGQEITKTAMTGILGGMAAEIPVELAVLCALVMGLGTATGGRRIVEKIGTELIRLKPEDGCAADGAAIFCLLGASLLGFPVSTTHVKTAAMVGAGMGSDRESRVRQNVAKELVIAWIVTLPGCLLLGYGMVRGMEVWTIGL